MFFGMPGPAELMIILTLGGGAGLPLGIPPAPEEPVLAKVAPEECLFYTSWAGTAQPDPNSENQTEQLLAEPEIQQMLAEIEQRIKTGLREAAQSEDPNAVPIVEDATKWAKTLLTQPTALFVSGVTIGPDGPDVRGGALVCVDEDAQKLQATLEKYQQMFLPGAVQTVEISGATWYQLRLDPKAPVITWGVRGRYFIVGVGEGSVEGILSRARTDPPAWLTDLRQQLPVERTATVSYVNVKKILQMALPMAGREAPQIQAALAATGLDNVTSLASVTGLDKTGFVNRTLLSLSGEPSGLLSLAAAKPLAADDLAPIPSDATIALAARLDAQSVFDTILSVVEKIEPRARAEVMDGLAEMERELAVNLRTDVLGALGDAWCVYNSPGEGGLVITGLTGVVQVKDRQALAAAHAKLLAVARAEMGPDTGRRRGPRIEQFKFAGQDVYFFNARESEFPLAPAWCLTEKELIVATFPQNIKAYLSRGDDFKPLSTLPEVAGVLQPGNGPVMLSYCDTPKLFELVYPLVPMFAQMVMSQLQREGIDVNVSILPSAKAIGKHLRPQVAAVRRHAAGIEMISHQALPGGSIGTTAPIAIGVLLPAVHSARGAARRAQSMNNLKQIGLALLNYHEAHGNFPPAYSADADGKPLLSWRVKILPYIEAKPLYDQFKLDEPWDSEHNKKLIAAMPATFVAPGSNAGPGKTNYLTVRGKDTVFPGKETVKIADIRDGSSNTAMVVEVNDPKAVIWTKPDDFEYDENNPIAGLVGLRPGGFNVLFCDGSVRFISAAVDPDTLRRLFTCNDGQVINHEEFMGPGPRGGLRPTESARPPQPDVAEEIEVLQEQEREEELEIVPRR